MLFDIVAADVLALLVMYLLDCEQLLAYTVLHRVAHRNLIRMPDVSKLFFDNWFIPLIRPPVDVCGIFDPGPRVHFTSSQLEKLHKQFFHSSVSKLFR